MRVVQNNIRKDLPGVQNMNRKYMCHNQIQNGVHMQAQNLLCNDLKMPKKKKKNINFRLIRM